MTFAPAVRLQYPPDEDDPDDEDLEDEDEEVEETEEDEDEEEPWHVAGSSRVSDSPFDSPFA